MDINMKHTLGGTIGHYYNVNFNDLDRKMAHNYVRKTPKRSEENIKEAIAAVQDGSVFDQSLNNSRFRSLAAAKKTQNAQKRKRGRPGAKQPREPECTTSIPHSGDDEDTEEVIRKYKTRRSN